MNYNIIRVVSFIVLVVVMLFCSLFICYLNNTKLVNPKTLSFYNELKYELKQNGFSNNLIVISTKRFKWHNYIQVKFNGAATKSRHLVGEAIDFVIFDINRDGISDGKDVDIVCNLLDKEIIKDEGGIGTYKGENNFFNRQMIHIDCRGYRARWNR
jgi:uncharacterized protein YcbK (DUF882 family)